jgi:hypothetical protein
MVVASPNERRSCRRFAYSRLALDASPQGMRRGSLANLKASRTTSGEGIQVIS